MHLRLCIIAEFDWVVVGQSHDLIEQVADFDKYCWWVLPVGGGHVEEELSDKDTGIILHFPAWFFSALTGKISGPHWFPVDYTIVCWGSRVCCSLPPTNKGFTSNGALDGVVGKSIQSLKQRGKEVKTNSERLDIAC